MQTFIWSNRDGKNQNRKQAKVKKQGTLRYGCSEQVTHRWGKQVSWELFSNLTVQTLQRIPLTGQNTSFTTNMRNVIWLTKDYHGLHQRAADPNRDRQDPIFKKRNSIDNYFCLTKSIDTFGQSLWIKKITILVRIRVQTRVWILIRMFGGIRMFCRIRMQIFGRTQIWNKRSNPDPHLE